MFFTLALTYGFLLVSKRQPVSSRLQDTSECLGQSQQCYCLGGFDLSSDFHSSRPLSKRLEIVRNGVSATGIKVTVVLHSFLCYLTRFKYLSLFSVSLIFSLWSAETAKSTRRQVLCIFLLIGIK